MKEFKKWRDLEELIEEGVITEATINDILREAGVKEDLTFDQFSKCLDMLETVSDAAENDQQIGVAQPLASFAGKPASSAKAATVSADEEDEGEGEGAEEDRDLTDEEVEAMTREMFDELKSVKTGKVTVKSLKGWEGLQDALKDEVLTMEKVDEVLKELGVKTDLDYEQFDSFLSIVEDAVDGDRDEDVDGEDDDEDRDLTDEEVDELMREFFDKLKSPKTGKVSVKALKNWDNIKDGITNGDFDMKKVDDVLKEFGVKNDLDYDQFNSFLERLEQHVDEGNGDATSDNNTDVEDADTDEDDEDELNDEDLKAITRQEFDALKSPKSGKVSIKALKNWEAVKDLIADGGLTVQEVDETLKELGVKGDLDYEQFDAFVEAIGGEDDEDGDDDDDKELTDDEVAEITREMFDELKSAKTGRVSVKALKAWDGIQDAIVNDELTMEGVDGVLRDLGVKGDLDFEQFGKVLTAIEELTDGGDGEGDGDNDDDDDNVTDDNDEDDDDDDEELFVELFEGLKDSKTGKLSVKTFKAWDTIQDAVDDDSLTMKDVDSLLETIGVKQDMDFEQFRMSVRLLDAMMEEQSESGGDVPVDDDQSGDDTEGGPTLVETTATISDVAESEEDDAQVEKILQETFDELKSPSTGAISVKAFLAWDLVADSIEAGDIDEVSVSNAIKTVLGKKKQMDFNEFRKCYDALENLWDSVDSGEEGEEGEEVKDVDGDDDEDLELPSITVSTFQQPSKGQEGKAAKPSQGPSDEDNVLSLTLDDIDQVFPDINVSVPLRLTPLDFVDHFTFAFACVRVCRC